LEAYLARIKSVEPAVNAWSLLDVAGARTQARILTEEAGRSRFRGPLHGIPIGVKDEFHIAGMPTGMRGWSELPLEREDATCVAKLRAAGAVILGKTHMPVNGKIPPTRNPWNSKHTAGGTSSGSGAAVAARMVPAAIGEQTMGSNLRPAAYCGVDAIKPTYGRISRFGCYPFMWSQDHVGIIGLTIEDIGLILSVIAGPDKRDPTALDLPAPDPNLRLEGYTPPKIGLVRNFFPERSTDLTNAAVEAAAARLRSAGASIVDAVLPEEFGLLWHLRYILEAEMNLFHAYDQAISPFAPSPAPKATDLIPVNYYLQARRIKTWLITQIGDFMSKFDALLMAATPSPAPPVDSLGHASLLYPWSTLGFPSLTINGGLSPEGLPIGLQFVATRMQDWELLRVGAWSEGVLGRLPAPDVDSDQRIVKPRRRVHPSD
jgi:aspartyl-tRNA(Asn)/glutamyl-tRNA(Gln) amidotransferase subunit A